MNVFRILIFVTTIAITISEVTLVTVKLDIILMPMAKPVTVNTD